MAEWKILLKYGEKQTVSAHTVEAQPSGALIFKNNGEDCPVKIVAADHWVSVDRVADNNHFYARPMDVEFYARPISDLI